MHGPVFDSGGVYGGQSGVLGVSSITVSVTILLTCVDGGLSQHSIVPPIIVSTHFWLCTVSSLVPTPLIPNIVVSGAFPYLSDFTKLSMIGYCLTIVIS